MGFGFFSVLSWSSSARRYRTCINFSKPRYANDACVSTYSMHLNFDQGLDHMAPHRLPPDQAEGVLVGLQRARRSQRLALLL